MTGKQVFELLLGLTGAAYLAFALFLDVYSYPLAALLASLAAYDLVQTHRRHKQP